MEIKERPGIGYSPLSSEGNKLRLALESDKIRPLWSSYSESVDLPEKTAKKILKPFFAGLAAAAVIASVGICKAEIDNYKLSHIPEVSELKQVRNEFGFDRAREIIYKDQGFYESLIEEYSAKRQDAKKIMLYGLGVGTSTAAAAFALVGIPIFRSRKKRFALEEALNKEGLSLAMLEGDSD